MVDTASTTVRLPVSIVNEVRVIAQAHERSLSAELRVALTEYIRRERASARRKARQR
jgi:predicted transcriptional regulator